MTRRTLRALGLDVAPARHPLSYPGRPVTEPALLAGEELTPLVAGPGRLGTWRVGTAALDHVLASLGCPLTGRRHPVLAVGSNASPAQLAHKLTRQGLPATVPMVPVRVRGIGVGCSGHIGRFGYVAAAPYADPAAERPLVASWLDAGQLAAVDATELNYWRVLLPGDAFAMVLPSGRRLGGAYLYVSKWGVLTDPGSGLPRPGGGDQSALLAALLLASPRLRALLGPGPGNWVERAAADARVRAAGAQVFVDEGWVRSPEGLPAYDPAHGGDGASALCQDDLEDNPPQVSPALTHATTRTNREPSIPRLSS
ncbi:hypothetical protein AB0F13_03325 [Streptomyces sp. NPDC026206]|uniref:hypothetical protein n=1 Tax=Streptomyces sp. NPDC026206 TaxID=3157089 RepID=UPI0033E24AF5